MALDSAEESLRANDAVGARVDDLTNITRVDSSIARTRSRVERATQ